MYTYKHFIPENIAPAGAKKIGVYDSGGRRICGIPLGSLTPPEAQKRYSFCALSDIHLTDQTANEDFQRALSYVNTSDCAFTCVAGDLTVAGTESELSLFKDTVAQYSPTKPVYAITGNHETAWGNYITDEGIEPYTGKPLYYSFTQGDDVFIMLGYYGAYHDPGLGWRWDEFLSVTELQWLYETLEANRNTRCFVFEHVLPHEHGVGNPNGLYTSALIWRTADGGIGQAFMSLLMHYKNVVFFHGHSHTRFYLQELDKKANYSEENGYKSVHIPSLALPRDVTSDGGALEKIYAESEGYIVDVYDDYIVLNGRDFIDNESDGHILPIATYKIDTPIQTVAAGTFVDSTKTIVT